MDAKDSYHKAVGGPGGLNCPCCCLGDKKYAKRLNARGKRRKAKMECLAVVKDVDFLSRPGSSPQED